MIGQTCLLLMFLLTKVLSCLNEGTKDEGLEFYGWKGDGEEKRKLFVHGIIAECRLKHGNRLHYTCYGENMAKKKQEGTGGTNGHFGYFKYFSVTLNGSLVEKPEELGRQAVKNCPTRGYMCDKLDVCAEMGCSKRNVKDSPGWIEVECMFAPTMHGLQAHDPDLCRYEWNLEHNKE